MLTAFAVLLCLTAILAWLNERFTKFPTTIGVTLSGTLASVALIGLDSAGLSFGLRELAESIFDQLDFTAFVLNGILSLLLFAGALSLDARQMVKQRHSVLILAIFSTLISTTIIGFAAWGVFRLVGLDVPLIGTLLLGALISPTDPVAVLDLLRRARVPKKIETLIAGESLFNDGVGVVLFAVLAGIAAGGLPGGEEITVTSALLLFGREALGGLAFGALLGLIGYYLTKTIDGHAVEVLITLAMVIGGYVAASALEVSGPLAMVIAGLGMSAGANKAFYGETREYVEAFWETLDQVLNIILFAFIGFDVLLTDTTGWQVLAALLLIPIVLASRFVSVGIPFSLVRQRDGYGPYTVRLLTWGGLRGGIAIGLALGLPPSDYRADLLTATYVIVLFTLAVQALTVMPLVRKAAKADRDLEAAKATAHPSEAA